MSDDDSLLDCLLENIEMIDHFSSSTSSFSDSEKSSIHNSSPVFQYSKKRSFKQLLDKREDDINSESSPNASSHNIISKLTKQVVIPRILKSDIRRKYLFMFTNVMNSYDFPLLDSFFRKFTASNVSLYKSPCQMDKGPAVALSGVNLLIYYMGAMLQTSPDKVIRLDGTTIKQRSDTEDTVLSANFSLKFTRFYNISPSIIASSILEQFGTSSGVALENPAKKAKKILAGNESLTNFEESREAFYHGEEYQNYGYRFDPLHPKSIQCQFPLLPKPSPSEIDGKFTMVIDGQKRIQQISMVPERAVFG